MVFQHPVTEPVSVLIDLCGQVHCVLDGSYKDRTSSWWLLVLLAFLIGAGDACKLK